MGHELLVFAPIRERSQGRIPINAQDEPFVYRNWEMHRLGDKIEDDAPLDLFFDPKPLLEGDFEILFVEKPTLTPISKLSEIFDVLKRKAKVVAVMHEGRVPANRRFYNLRWDLAVVFDGRFLNLYGHLLNANRVSVVPFPCHPVVQGDKRRARGELNLPLDGHLVLAFGIRAYGLRPIMPVLERVAKDTGMRLLLLVEHDRFRGEAEALKKSYDFVHLIYDAPSFSKLYTYLHASDALLLHRPAADYVPISSTVHLCLGALRPILCPDNNFFHGCDGVLKYSGPADLEAKLRLVLEDGPPEELLERAKRYIEEREAKKIARRLLELALDP